MSMREQDRVFSPTMYQNILTASLVSGLDSKLKIEQNKCIVCKTISPTWYELWGRIRLLGREQVGWNFLFTPPTLLWASSGVSAPLPPLTSVCIHAHTGVQLTPQIFRERGYFYKCFICNFCTLYYYITPFYHTEGRLVEHCVSSAKLHT